MGWRPVTGKGARVPGPNPNSSYRLRYVPAPAAQTSGRREASFAITGAHLHKTWSAYCRCVGGDPPVWDRNFVSGFGGKDVAMSGGYLDWCVDGNTVVPAFGGHW